MKRLSGKLVFLLTLLGISAYVSADTVAPYAAFSLTEAENRIRQRKDTEMVESMCGITRLLGVVVDAENRDVVLVGQLAPRDPPLSLPDLAVALRARFRQKQWPLVSIDRTAETATTGNQTIRFEGGIENTRMGEDLLKADIVLKRLSLNELPTDIWGFPSYFSLALQRAKKTPQERNISTRFWFCPKCDVAVRPQVAIVKQLYVTVKAELMAANLRDQPNPDLSKIRNEAAETFADAVTASYGDLAGAYPEVRRVKTLLDAVALAHGLESLQQEALLRYWLDQYTVPKVATSNAFPVLRREVEDNQFSLSISGGVRLKSILQRIDEEGDITAIRDITLESRPNGHPLAWRIPLVNWQMPGYPDAPTDKGSSTAWQIPDALPIGCSVTEQLRLTAQPTLPDLSFPSSQLSQRPLITQPVPTFSDRVVPQRYSLNVGGVLLNDVARVEGEIGAGATLGKGSFSVVVDGRDCGIDQIAYKRLVTALWAVYFGREDPGISIDPIARGAERQLVRYIGNVQNLDLGRVMREADYLMKKWAVGTEQPSIATFKTPDDYANELKTLYLGSMSRFWFVPENMKFKVTPDALLFDSGNMTVKTEFLMSNVEGRSADPANERFAQWFTENYHGEVINRYPIYHQLYDYAKLVALAKYLKESGVPLYWFLMANKDLVLTEDAPGSVPALFKDSKHFPDVKIEGGVNLVQKDVKAKGYIFDEATKNAIRLAYQKSTAERGSTSLISDRPKYVAQPVSLELGTNQCYTAIPQHSSSSGKDRRGIRYQTDISLRTEGFEITPKVLAALQPAIRQRHVWNDLRDKIDGLMKGKSEAAFETAFENALQAAQAKTGEALRKLALLQGKFYPTEPEFAKDAAFALEDKDQFELLGDILVSYAKYYTSLDLVRVFDPNRANQPGDFGDGWRLLVPYRLRPASKTAAKGYSLPSKMEVVNLITDRREVLDFGETNQMIGYFPATNSPSEFVAVLVLENAFGGLAGFRLMDRIGCEFQFNSDLNLTELLFTEDHNISIEYLEKTGTAFETPPYQVLPENTDDRVTFRNVTLPKRMKVTDAFGAVQIMEFTEKESPVGWYPSQTKSSRLKALALMSDASYVLADAKGNEFAFDGGGHFTEARIGQEEPIVRSLKMGKNRISFRYRLDPAGNILIAKAWVGQDEIGAKPLYVINYDYDSTGRLANRQLLFAGGKSVFGQ